MRSDASRPPGQRPAGGGEEPGAKWPDRKRLIKGIFSHHDTRPGSWDPATGQSLGTGGIWNDVELVASGDVRITSVRVTPTLLDDGTARARLSLEAANYPEAPTEGEVGVALVPDNFEGARLEIALEDGRGAARLAETLNVDIPENEAVLILNTWPRNGTWAVTDALAPGRYTLRLILRSQDGELVGENEYPVEVLETPGAFKTSF